MPAPQMQPGQQGRKWWFRRSRQARQRGHVWRQLLFLALHIEPQFTWQRSWQYGVLLKFWEDLAVVMTAAVRNKFIIIAFHRCDDAAYNHRCWDDNANGQGFADAGIRIIVRKKKDRHTGNSSYYCATLESRSKIACSPYRDALNLMDMEKSCKLVESFRAEGFLALPQNKARVARMQDRSGMLHSITGDHFCRRLVHFLRKPIT